MPLNHANVSLDQSVQILNFADKSNTKINHSYIKFPNFRKITKRMKRNPTVICEIFNKSCFVPNCPFVGMIMANKKECLIFVT